VDALDLESGKTTRIFHSEAPYYEEPFAFVDVGARKLLTRRESAEEPPNYYVRALSSGGVQALTRFPHPYPGLVGATRELVRYPRADSVQLTATLHSRRATPAAGVFRPSGLIPSSSRAPTPQVR
jgi:dipeptidyl aminopeptidase/acylaminoacyl peptidase